jgi:hypothetical protein
VKYLARLGYTALQEFAMPSPFPGFDPYIEAQGRWPSFHTGYITACQEQLNSRLPQNYFATVDERVLLDVSDRFNREILHRIGPDVALLHQPQTPLAEPDAADHGGVVMLTPRTLPQSIVAIDQPTQKFIEIRALPDERLVTTIELLSPSNKKPGDDRSAFLAKRTDLLRHGVNVVDIDLLVSGHRLPLLAPIPPGDYHAFITNPATYDHCDVYSWSVRDTLPVLTIPLKADEAATSLDLQVAFTHVYDHGRYRQQLRYGKIRPTMLSEVDLEWAMQRVQSSV